LAGEFTLSAWSNAGLNVPAAVKCGLFTVNNTMIIEIIGQLVRIDKEQLDLSLRAWLGLP
jgi:mRNA interferase MazF